MTVSAERCIDEAIWIAHSLFFRGKTSGSSANMSFMDHGQIYITCSGSCFGRLTKDSFVAADAQFGRNPSKELPLHRSVYRMMPEATCVIHIHGFYSTLWSCVGGTDPNDAVPAYTPYLNMKLGKIMLIPYAPPGSKELFELFESHADGRSGYLLAHHGALVAGKTLADAFYGIEELEESCHIAWECSHHSNIVPIEKPSLAMATECKSSMNSEGSCI